MKERKDINDRDRWLVFGSKRATIGAGILATAFAMTIVSSVLETRGYRNGQIDAMNGKWKYHQVLHIDTTRTYDYKK